MKVYTLDVARLKRLDNCDRLYSTLRYLSPLAFELTHQPSLAAPDENRSELPTAAGRS